MEKDGTVGQVAALFGIAPSTVRYWDDQGLLRFGRNEENNYRVPNVFTLLDVCDVMFYRALSLSVKDIRRLPNLDVAALRALMDDSEAELERKIEAMEASIHRIQRKRELLNRLETLRAAPLDVVRAKLPPVESFGFTETATARAYAADPHNGAILVEADGGAPVYGMLGGGKLRPGDAQERTYLHGLFSTSAADPAENDARRFWTRAGELGRRPGTLVGQYLATAFEGGRRDFYEAWMELL